MSRVYYNEYDKFAAAWLRKLIDAGHIPKGDVDERSIVDVRADDLRAYRQCHFFAGIGGWSHALRLAGWPDDREIWTGSCPCQPFSVAGKGKGKSDERHLWPVFFSLIRDVRPAVVMGEQVAGKSGYDWFDGVRSDLAGEDYSGRAVDIPACAVNAPHIRQRLYWVAYTDSKSVRGRLPGEIVSSSGSYEGEAPKRQRVWSDAGADRDYSGLGDANSSMLQTRAGDRLGIGEAGISERSSAYSGNTCSVVNANGAGQREYGRAITVSQEQPSTQCAGGDAFDMADADSQLHDGSRNIRPGWGNEYPNSRSGSFWSEHEWLTGADGKTRRAKPGVRLLVDGVPNRVGRLRGYGNAIVPPLAAEVIKAFMEVAP